MLQRPYLQLRRSALLLQPAIAAPLEERGMLVVAVAVVDVEKQLALPPKMENRCQLSVER